MALLSLDKACHRAIEKGFDASLLGRWCWTRLRGKNNYSVRIYSGYCPNPPTGPLSVYAQHRQYLINKKDDRCSRLAFIQDLCEDIKKAMVQGDKIVLMLDGNMDMKQGIMANHFKNIMLKEAIIVKYGSNGPSTFR
jgi:hypothetical protein